MAYTPRNVPTDPAALPEYLRAELQRLAQELESAQPLVRVAQSNVAVAKPRKGDVAYADGTNWGPGPEGFYWFDGTDWQPLSLSLGNAGYGWRDMFGSASIRGNPSNSPTWAVYRGGVYQLQFGNGTKEMQFEYHIQHDYKPGSDLYIHVHWSQIVVDTGGTASAPGDAKWYFEVSYGKGHQQAAFAAPITTSVTQTASATQYMHNIAEVQLSAASPSAAQLDSDDIEVDGVLLVRMYRDSTDVADTLNQAPFVHFVDLHYQVDRFATKNKSPSFY